MDEIEVNAPPPSDDALAKLAADVGGHLAECGLKVTTAESCTGGWIAKAITDVPGSSAPFEVGFIVYSNGAKSTLLDVPAALIAEVGAVSREVTETLAQNARQVSGADIAVAVSGIAGPGGGTDEKPVGTVWFAWANDRGVESQCVRFGGDRDAVRRHTVAHALRGVLERVAP